MREVKRPCHVAHYPEEGGGEGGRGGGRGGEGGGRGGEERGGEGARIR